MSGWNSMEEYFRALGRCLNCPREDRERFLDQARRMADDFVQGKPDASPDEVADCLGAPEELAQCFLDSLDQEMLEQYQKRRKLRKRILVGTLVVLMGLLIIWVGFLKTRPKAVEVTETLMIYEEGSITNET